MSAEYTSEQRAKIIETVITGLGNGTPLAVLCRQDGMPNRRTINRWSEDDAELKSHIACARDDGYDMIAMEALAIADNTEHDTKLVGEEGQEREVANSEWISRSKLRVDTRLKLLAKWDPKRYGDRQLIGSDPENPLPAGVSVTFKS